MSKQNVEDPLARLRELREVDGNEDSDDFGPVKTKGSKINIASYDFAETGYSQRVEQVDLFAESGATDVLAEAENLLQPDSKPSLFNPDGVQPVDIISAAADAKARAAASAFQMRVPLGREAENQKKVSTEEPEVPEVPEVPYNEDKDDAKEESDADKDEEEAESVDPLGVQIKKTKKVSLFGDDESDEDEASEAKLAVKPVKPLAQPKPAASAALSVAPVTRRSTLFDDDDSTTTSNSSGLDGIFIPKAAIASRTDRDRVQHEDKSEAADLIEDADQTAEDILEKFGSVEDLNKKSSEQTQTTAATRIIGGLFDSDDTETETSASKPTVSLFSSSSATSSDNKASSNALDDDLFGMLGGAGGASQSGAGVDIGDFNFSAYISSQEASTKANLLDD